MHLAFRGLLLAPLFLMAASLTACGSGKAPQPDLLLRTSSGKLPDEWAFHRLGTSDGIIDCTAEIDASPGKTFGFNLTKDLGLLPVQLVFNLVGDGVPVRISEESLQPVLFLANGTALESASASDVRERMKKKYREGFDRTPIRSALLQKAGNSPSRHEGYVFFALPNDTRTKGGRLVVGGVSGEGYEVDLRHSVLQVSYTAGAGADDQVKTISIGTR